MLIPVHSITTGCFLEYYVRLTPPPQIIKSLMPGLINHYLILAATIYVE